MMSNQKTIKKSQLKQLIKEVISILNEALRGEWWIQDGQAVFADGDVGDMNHESYVISNLMNEIYDELGIDISDPDHNPNFSDMREEIFESIGDELTPEEIEAWNNGELMQVIASYLIRNGDDEAQEKLYYIRGRDDKGITLDGRMYALKHWGWQRVKGTEIQTQTLTTEDLKHISRGLYDAYGDQLDDVEPEEKTELNPMGEYTFNIDVISTRSYYRDVPLSILEKNNPTALNAYKTRY